MRQETISREDQNILTAQRAVYQRAHSRIEEIDNPYGPINYFPYRSEIVEQIHSLKEELKKLERARNALTMFVYTVRRSTDQINALEDQIDHLIVAMRASIRHLKTRQKSLPNTLVGEREIYTTIPVTSIPVTSETEA